MFRKYAIILVIALLLALPFFSYQAKAQVTIEKISSFNHQMFVNDYGFILVNETIFIKNDLESPATLPLINITYPQELYNKIIPQVISPNNFNFNIALTENHTRLTIDSRGYEIQPNESVTISVKFYLVKIFSPAGDSNYTAPIPLVPALSLPIKQVNSSLSIPSFIIFGSQHKNFTAIQTDYFTWELIGAFSNVTQGFSRTENVTISVLEVENIYFALLEFTEAKRELILSPLGDIRVRDTITMINYDNRSVIKLKPSPLTNDFKSIIIIPPLTNPFSNPLSDANNRQVDLGANLTKGERYTVTLEYPIRSLDFIKAKDGLFELSLPLKTPIDGVVYNYTVKVILPEGFFAYSKTEESKVNASSLDGEQKIDFRLGLAWASKDIMPIASFIFIVTLVAFIIVGKPFIKEELKEIAIRAREYIESFEEKITATKELIDLYKKRQSSQISKIEFKTTQRLLEERRSKATIKINELRPKLISLQPSLQEHLSRIGDLHRDYDRAVKELINLYEQLFTKKVRAEAFDRLLPVHQRRVDEARESLLNSIDTLRREVE
ncbi:MAG: hypothetical protein H3Z54_10585 [archaeon]|nr:hypothetical protein [archaeon]